MTSQITNPAIVYPSVYSSADKKNQSSASVAFVWGIHRWLFFLAFFRMCFFQGQTLFWPILRNAWSDWSETKRKCIGWILGTICDLDLWPHSWPWPWMFQGEISKYLFLRNCWSDWCEIKTKWISMILGRLYDLALWPHPWPWPWELKFQGQSLK